MVNQWHDIRDQLDRSEKFTDVAGTPWYSDAVYERFSAGEYERRHAAARRLAADAGVDALLLTGSVNTYSLGGGVTWGSGLIDPRGMCQYMVLPLEGEPTLVYPHPGCHIEAARKQVGIADVRDGQHGHYAQVIADRLRELGLEAGRLGVTLCDRTGGEYMGVTTYLELRKQLPELEIVFLPDLFHQLTKVKSAEELAAAARAGELVVAALEAIARTARPGVKEYQLAAAATHAILDGGGVPHLIMVGSTSMHDPRIVFPNPMPSARVLAEGDVILNEIAGSYLGYSAKIGQPVSVGEPTARYRRFYTDVVLSGFHEIRSAIRAGADLTDIQKAAGAFRRNGAQSRPIVFHGIDLITSGPMVLTDRVSAAPDDRTLLADQTVNIEITPIDGDGLLGMFLSRTFRVTGGEPEELTPFPLDDILVAG
jgi:Xaa-Pro aminopeptidase